MSRAGDYRMTKRQAVRVRQVDGQEVTGLLEIEAHAVTQQGRYRVSVDGRTVINWQLADMTGIRAAMRRCVWQV